MRNFILADNQEVTRFAVESLVRRDQRNTVKLARCRAELVMLLQENENSVVVLDYTLFDFASADQLLITSERFAMATWVLFSEDLTPRFLNRVIYSSHVFSVVFKDSSLRNVQNALLAADQGKRFLSQRVMEMILKSREDEKPCPLTNTELEVVKAIAQGKTTREIATERFSSIHTVTTHRKNIFRKLKVNTAHELLKYALRMGWVDSSEFYI